MDNNNIRVLTMWEPWATLLIHGIKRYETRPNHTTHRGVYLIHTAKKFTKDQKKFCGTIGKHLRLCGIYSHSDFNLGAIIGSVEIIGCVNMVDHLTSGVSNKNNIALNTLSIAENTLGDWQVGRSAWIFKNRKILKTPIPYKGGQGYYQKFKSDTTQLDFKLVI